MNNAAAELQRLHRLDRHTRLRATRAGWMLPILFAALVPIEVALGITDYRYAVPFALTAAVLAMWTGYALSRSAARTYGTGEARAVLWLSIASIVAAGIALPLLGAATGWALLASCGAAVAVAVGLEVINLTVARPAARGRQALLLLPGLLTAVTSLTSYAAGQQLGQPAAVLLGLLAQGWIWRWIITR